MTQADSTEGRIHSRLKDGVFLIGIDRPAKLNGFTPEMLRPSVLAVGGRLVFQEVLGGPVTPPHFPVPWAREAGLSYLPPPETVHDLLAKAGFREMIWRDVTAQYLREYRKLAANSADPDGPPPLGLHLILGPDAGRMRKNVVRNLEEQRIVLIQCVLKKS